MRIPPVATGKKAETIRRYQTTANQGATVGPNDVYAIRNFEIIRFDKKTGEEKARWLGDKARFPHINSCALIQKELVCGSSNFPGTPHVSSVEFFDPTSLAHKRSVSLGLGTGSLTWVDRKDGAWWALFANYDNDGKEAPRDHTWTTLVKFDDQWRRLEAWGLPKSVLERMSPMSASGGGWGPDGRLYLSGHDRPEIYALVIPPGGGVLDHVETIEMEAEGQAIDWDESQPGMLYGITRRTREILAMKVPVPTK
ncbi:MAG: hypothetical protein BGN86_05545 [Caulobacterales bacterium 68-7]|nr:MAG: hypothetical protein BGN86_05545 [Caulobacterales bacterium 68-7]